jgi:hypothetical protein
VQETTLGANQESPRNGYGNGHNRDPSGNVLDLVDASAKRQDDLREQAQKYGEKIADMRAWYDEKLRLSEAGRLNAIRATDQANVEATASVQAQAAIALAKQVVDSAEALRTTVEQERVARATALDAETEPIKKDITEIRKIQYEEAGGKLQQTETREKGLSTAQWLMVVVGVAGLFLTFLLIIATVVVAITTKGFTA